jgi:hypothetical protein
VTQLEARERRIDPRWNLTYEFASPESARALVNTHVLSVHTTVSDYPTTAAARRAVVRSYGPGLVEEWISRRLPPGELYHLVHRPGELDGSTSHWDHRSGEPTAPAHDLGGVPVVVVLTNTPLRPDLVVSRVRL